MELIQTIIELFDDINEGEDDRVSWYEFTK